MSVKYSIVPLVSDNYNNEIKQVLTIAKNSGHTKGGAWAIATQRRCKKNILSLNKDKE